MALSTELPPQNSDSEIVPHVEIELTVEGPNTQENTESRTNRVSSGPDMRYKKNVSLNMFK